MPSLKEIKGIEPKVEKLLKEHPHLRDNDNRLICNIWFSEIPNINDISAVKFLKIFSEGNITSGDSITRARRKLQEKNEEYRGEKYEERHKEEQNVRDNINN